MAVLALVLWSCTALAGLTLLAIWLIEYMTPVFGTPYRAGSRPWSSPGMSCSPSSASCPGWRT